MTDPARAELIAVLTAARALLASVGDEYAASSWWGDLARGLAELDRLIAALRSPERPRRLDLEILFAPTGPLREISEKHPWGEAFEDLARRFDAVIAKVYAT